MYKTLSVIFFALLFTDLVCARAQTSFFTSSNVPAILDFKDNSVELGIKFSTSAAGQITAIKFYKANVEAFPHTLSLWDNSTKALLGSTVSSNENGTGWQTVTLTTPINVVAGKTYVASYHAHTNYSVTENYFTKAITSPPLTAPISAGVYAYGSSSACPFQSYKSLNYWVDVVFATGEPTPTPTPKPPGTSTINWSDIHQLIDGFGASCAQMDQSLTEAQADMFFSPTAGVGFSIIRNEIFPDGNTTPVELLSVQKAVARGAKVFSTPWSPPAAWKSNGSTINGGSLLRQFYPYYATQLANYVQTMKNAGVNVYAVSIQNEPDYAAPTYDSAVWSADDFHVFVPLLFNALSSARLSSTKIMMPEESGWAFDLASFVQADSTTAAEIGVYAAHSYYNDPFPPATGGKALWATEDSRLNDAYDGSMSDALNWASKIHDYLTIANVNAWCYWQLNIDWGPDNEGLTDNFGNPAKRLYTMGNFSKFVRPGFNRIGVNADSRLLVSAYKDSSGNFAIVAINNNSSAVVTEFNLNGFTTLNVTPSVTSASLSLVSQAVVPVSGSGFVYTIPGQSVVTFSGKSQ